ncbi:unnamed protein product [Cylicostephanus goldi]|uniref:Uncharacterized protein n=1 Tax=Cylicostephanus goldi TaxID=71465 RepID=A0A3P7PHQ7_CYLGO|nr:unnamed protein product [Cylicostephanus goldi]
MIYILLLCVGIASAGVGRFRRGGYGRPEIFPPPLPDQGLPPPPPPPPMGGGYGRPSFGGGGYGGPSSFTSVNIYDQPQGGYGRPSGYGRPAGFGGFGQGGFGGGSDFGSFGGRI